MTAGAKAARSVPGSGAPDVSEDGVRTASAAVLLVGRRVLVAALSAVSTSIVARSLGAEYFGQLSSALAMYYLVAAVSDFGFSQVITRRLAVHPGRRGAVVRAGVRVASVWSSALCVATVVLAALAGLHAPRGQALLVLAPAVAGTGLLGLRQVLLVANRLRPMTLIDIATNLVQAAVISTLALCGFGVGWLAGATAAGMMVNTVLCAVVALRVVDATRPARGESRRLVREALPLGLASVVSSAYFSIDMVLIGHLAPGQQVGDYAAAVKVLSILVAVPGIIMGAALPGLSLAAADGQRLSLLVSRVWHLLAATALPACITVGMFAPLVIALLYGSAYGNAAVLLRVLVLAAVVSVVNNLLSGVLVALRRGPRMLLQNSVGLVGNVLLNISLVPVFGVVASAWATLATELVVCVAAFVALSGRVQLGPSLAASARPASATTAAATTAAGLHRWPVPALLLSVGVFVAGNTALRGWPRELWVRHHGRG
ncbi:MAG: hypothetical protein V7603_5784 [Micromonosporaceae bacterium]